MIPPALEGKRKAFPTVYFYFNVMDPVFKYLQRKRQKENLFNILYALCLNNLLLYTLIYTLL